MWVIIKMSFSAKIVVLESWKIYIFRTLSMCDELGTVGKLLYLLFVYLNKIQHHISVDVVNESIK